MIPYLLIRPHAHYTLSPCAYDSAVFTHVDGTGATPFSPLPAACKTQRLKATTAGQYQCLGQELMPVTQVVCIRYSSLGASGPKTKYHSMYRPVLSNLSSFNPPIEAYRLPAVRGGGALQHKKNPMQRGKTTVGHEAQHW